MVRGSPWIEKSLLWYPNWQRQLVPPHPSCTCCNPDLHNTTHNPSANGKNTSKHKTEQDIQIAYLHIAGAFFFGTSLHNSLFSTKTHKRTVFLAAEWMPEQELQYTKRDLGEFDSYFDHRHETMLSKWVGQFVNLQKDVFWSHIIKWALPMYHPKSLHPKKQKDLRAVTKTREVTSRTGFAWQLFSSACSHLEFPH